MKNKTHICRSCKKPYEADATVEKTLCESCHKQWELEARWEASEEAWREQENEMLRARGFIIIDNEDEDNRDFLDIEDDEYCDWLCDICGDPIYDCGHYVCGHCGTALSHDAIGKHDICPNCEYELEHPQDEIEYENFDQVHDPNYPF